MKHLLMTLLFFVQPSLAAEVVELSFGYQKSSNYLVSQKNTSDMTMGFSGDLNSLPMALRQKLPLKVKAIQEVDQIIETGDLNSDDTYPITLLTNKNKTLVSINGADYNEQPSTRVSLEGLKIQGIMHTDGKMEYKSASGGSVTDEIKATLQSVFEQLSSSNIMAGTSSSIGETTSFRTPMSIPVGDMGAVNFEMDIGYTLNSIQNNMANYKIKFDVVISTKLKEANIKLVGSGFGVMEYDILNKFSPIITSETNMDVQIPFKGGFLDLSLVTYSNIRTVQTTQ